MESLLECYRAIMVDMACVRCIVTWTFISFVYWRCERSLPRSLQPNYEASSAVSSTLLSGTHPGTTASALNIHHSRRLA